MSSDFKEKLQLYRQGMLNESEVASIEKEIERFIAINDYLDASDEEFIDGLKKEMDSILPAESSIGKKINRKMIKKVVSLSLVTILLCFIAIPILYISTSSLLGRISRVDSTRFVAEENFSREFLHMAFPKVISYGGSDNTQFYNQQFICNYTKDISRKALSSEIEVNYSFGKLKNPKNTIEKKLQSFEKDKFYAINSQTYFNSTDWNSLEKAPDGTKAQIFVTFKSKFSPKEAYAALGEQYFNPQKNVNIVMLADINSEIVVANMDPVYCYESNNNSTIKQDELNYINKYNTYDNEIHKQVLLFGLNKIKKHRNIANYITANYSINRQSDFENIGKSISYVEKNGVLYVGALISGDTKELLKLKGNPNIFACSVEDIVVW